MEDLIAPNLFLPRECTRLGIETRESFIRETYAQCNEDIIIESIFRSLMFRTRRDMSQVRYIEIGANHPIHHSNTYLLYRRYKARGVLIEPIPELCTVLANARPNDIVVNCAASARFDEETPFYCTGGTNALSTMERDNLNLHNVPDDNVREITVKNRHINDILEEYWGDGIDFLSIDTEGLDEEIILSIDYNKFLPSIIQCEPDKSTNIIHQLIKNNYILLAATQVNYIFMSTTAFLGIRL
jgi:FkbM family methyltransferase